MRLSMNVERLRLWALLAPFTVVQKCAEAALKKCRECCQAHCGCDEDREAARNALVVEPFKPLARDEVNNPGMDASIVLDWIERNDFIGEGAKEEHVRALMGLAALSPKAPLPTVEPEPEPVDADETTEGSGDAKAKEGDAKE